MTASKLSPISLGLLAFLAFQPGCDSDSNGGGGSSTTSGSASDTDPSVDPPTTTAGTNPLTTGATTTVGSDSDTDTLAPCVDVNIGGAIGDAVASGNTQGGTDDFSLQSCGGGSSTSGFTTDPGTTGGDTGSGTTGGFTTGAGTSAGGTTAGPGGDGGDYVVAWTPEAGGMYTISTTGSGIDTVLSVTAPECGSDAIECNDDCVDLASSVTYDATAGETVFIVVEGFGGRRGAFTLSISEGIARECDGGDSTGGDSTGGSGGTTGTTGVSTVTD